MLHSSVQTQALCFLQATRCMQEKQQATDADIVVQNKQDKGCHQLLVTHALGCHNNGFRESTAWFWALSYCLHAQYTAYGAVGLNASNTQRVKHSPHCQNQPATLPGMR